MLAPGSHIAYLWRMERPKNINRLNDALVKYIFAREEHQDILLSLINAALAYAGKPVLKDVCTLNPELDADFYHGKSGRVDILRLSSDKTLTNVEFQIAKLLCMGERSLFYWAYIYRLNEGQEYDELPRTICLNILDFTFFDPAHVPDFFNSFAILNEKYPQNRLSKTFEMHFIELPKWKRQQGQCPKDTLLDKWLAYFSPSTDEKELQSIAREVPEIARALKAEEVFMANADLRYAYDVVEKNRRDAVAHDAYVRQEAYQEAYQDGVKDGQAKGFQDGEKKGEKKGICKIIANMVEKGLSFQDISDMTGIPLTDVRTFVAQMG